ncbi:hypothetical protein ACSBR1_011769 [Camellia fascicularis]
MLPVMSFFLTPLEFEFWNDLDVFRTVSGLSGTTKTAQSQVSVGMRLLAGSTVVILTVIWGTFVIVGKCDLHDSIAIDGKHTKKFSLTGSGVTTDIWTSYAARIMAISVIPFLVVQIPQVMDSTSGRHLAVLIALIVSVCMLISYCLYQVFQAWIQRRRLAYAKHKHLISGFLKYLKMHALGRFIKGNGELNTKIVEKLFHTIDRDKDGFISEPELKALILGMRLDEINFDQIYLTEDDAVKKVMNAFDTSNDYKIDLLKFNNGISKWLDEAKQAGAPSREAGTATMKYLDDFHKQTKREHYLLGDQSGDQSVDQTAFANPLVDAVDNFSDATSIPSFFISFIALPLVTSSSEAVSGIIFSSLKRMRSASLTFSEGCFPFLFVFHQWQQCIKGRLYGAVTIKNILCLSVFLALFYVRGLTWDFSAEVLVVLVVCLVMGGFASFRTTFPLWTALVAFFLYPFSLALVYVLDYVLGWS